MRLLQSDLESTMSLAADYEPSAAPSADLAKPIVSISVITPKPGMFEEAMALQLAQNQRLRGKVEGVLGARVFRSKDARSFVLIAAFETIEASQRFREDPRLLDHLARMRPLMESAAQGAYETVYEVGAI
jgi:quinol monooxygenase YgiN